MTDSYETPKWILDIFAGFYDPCPLDNDWVDDGLKTEWGSHNFVNPPYSNPLPWIEKAIKEREKGRVVVLLLKMDTSTKWFKKLQEAGAHFLWINGRLKFRNIKHEVGYSPATFPSMLAILS